MICTYKCTWFAEQVKDEMVERAMLSKGEMEVVRLLWKLAPASVRQIHEALPEDRRMDFATVQTYLRRLENKGYAKSTLEGRVRIYSARTKARTVIRETVDDLVNRLFAGDTMPLMRHLIEERGIGEKELTELREMLDRLEKQGCDE